MQNLEIINLPKVPFSVETLQRIETTGQLKDNLDAINYIFEYYRKTRFINFKFNELLYRKVIKTNKSKQK